NRKLEADAKDAVALSRAAAVYAQMGNESSALDALNKVLEIAPNDGLALYNCACTYAQLSRKKEAIKFLQKALGNGYKNIVEWIENDPDF
ncbi:MAG: tetratricopeptide repeat protein, partial [Aliifodinibius sp.]|nr:tetratricopeptide repeat protein [Fodinibius sp.]NIV12068.1 tetratricopeptide repeat protein [Fodinibius sp.]NIV99225.1 tetratricopeptide repeat protein [Candidatus Saccharibacteria bacterium]NIY26218.1 tetratricopeptide repeat protein [Fodinibius sp.]